MRRHCPEMTMVWFLLAKKSKSLRKINYMVLMRDWNGRQMVCVSPFGQYDTLSAFFHLGNHNM